MAECIRKIEEKVLDILVMYPEARANDFVLYARYIQTNNPELKDVGLIYALTAAKQIGMPNYESVTRARRKIQAKCPELKAPYNVSRQRSRRRSEFEEYARSGSGVKSKWA